MTGTSLRRRAKRVDQGGGSGPPATYSNIPLPPTGLKEPTPTKLSGPFPCKALIPALLGQNWVSGLK